MSIRDRIEDAYFLGQHGRAAGALLSACAAVSATSRLRYPDRRMSDREAFTSFLRDEMRVVTAGFFNHVIVRCPGADQRKYPNEEMPLQDVLYEFVRCALSHEGRVGSNVVFDESELLRIEIKDNCIVLGGEFLKRLIFAAQFAPENLQDFPDIANTPADVVGWTLFDQRRDSQGEYLRQRQDRLEALKTTSCR